MITKQEKAEKIKEWLKKTKLDAEVTNQTIGVASGEVSPLVLLRTSEKLIKINKKEAEPDDRDNLLYSKFLGIEDFVSEHIEKDAGKLQRKALNKIKQKNNIDWMQSGFFTPQVKSVIIGNSLSQHVEGVNMMENLDVSQKITKLGPGGIPSTDAIPDESRQVQQSSFGFLDPFRISESKSVGVDHRVANNVFKGKDNKLYRKMLDSNNNEVFVDHETILKSKVELPNF